ncbi:MAG: MerR family transcriptional regulator [Alphaproteobacteria bacterium]
MSDELPFEGRAAEPERSLKATSAFRTISEVAEELGVPQHVLRFWETKFSQIRPLKRGGGRRYYRPDDIDILRRVKGLLYSEGYTIKGAQKLLRQSAQRGRPAPPPALATDELAGADARRLKALRDELVAIRRLLDEP